MYRKSSQTSLPAVSDPFYSSERMSLKCDTAGCLEYQANYGHDCLELHDPLNASLFLRVYVGDLLICESQFQGLYIRCKDFGILPTFIRGSMNTFKNSCYYPEERKIKIKINDVDECDRSLKYELWWIYDTDYFRGYIFDNFVFS